MKKHIKRIFIAAGTIFLTAFHTAAAAPLLSSPGLAKSNDINQEVGYIIQNILAAAFILAVLALIVGGFIYVTAANSKRVDLAKKILSATIVGLVVILLAYTIAATINTIFTKQ